MYVHVYVYAYTPKHANQVGVAVSPGLLNMALAARFAANCSPIFVAVDPAMSCAAGSVAT